MHNCVIIQKKFYCDNLYERFPTQKVYQSNINVRVRSRSTGGSSLLVYSLYSTVYSGLIDECG